MPLISIPYPISKGVSFDITLDMSELLSNVSDPYFQIQANIDKALLTYASVTNSEPENEQKKTLNFDASVENPISPVIFSSTARNLFVLKKIRLLDRDGGMYDVSLRDIEKEGFNINLIPPPSSLIYSSPVSYTVGVAITNNTPTVTGTVSSYSISSALPSGLSFNTTTGIISGTPSVASIASNYTVSATNINGSTTSIVNLAVISAIAAPSSLSYYRQINDMMGDGMTNITESDVIYTRGAGYPLYAEVTGTVDSYSITPSLPTGMSFNTTTGQISGSPTNSQGRVEHTITATNAGGSTNTVLRINVNDPTINITKAMSVAVVHNATYMGLPTNTAWFERLLPSTDLGSSKNASAWYTIPFTGDFRYFSAIRVGLAADGSNVKGIIGLNDTLSFTSPYSVKDTGWGIEFDGSTLEAKPWGTNETPYPLVIGQTRYFYIQRVNGVITFTMYNFDPESNIGNPGLVKSQWTHSITNSATLYIVHHFQQGSFRTSSPRYSIN